MFQNWPPVTLILLCRSSCDFWFPVNKFPCSLCVAFVFLIYFQSVGKVISRLASRLKDSYHGCCVWYSAHISAWERTYLTFLTSRLEDSSHGWVWCRSYCYHSTPAPRYPWKFEDFCLRAKINLDCLRSRGIEQSNLLWCDWRCIKSESVARCFGDKTGHPKTLHWPWLCSIWKQPKSTCHRDQRVVYFKRIMIKQVIVNCAV